MNDQDNGQDNDHDFGGEENQQAESHLDTSAEHIAELNEEARGRSPRDHVEKQDLGEARLRRPDRNWPSGQALQSSVAVPPTRERLARKTQTVSVRNSSDRIVNANGLIHPQTHIVFDRHQRSIELRPGETRHGVEMLVGDIDYFLRQGAKRNGPDGRPLPRHPVEVLNVDARDIQKQARDDHERMMKARERAEEARHEFAQRPDYDDHDERGRHDRDEDEHDDGEHEQHTNRRPLGKRSKKR